MIHLKSATRTLRVAFLFNKLPPNQYKRLFLTREN